MQAIGGWAQSESVRARAGKNVDVNNSQLFWDGQDSEEKEKKREKKLKDDK